MKNSPIITVGLCPCWDITCRADDLHWGDHKKISSQTQAPAGKALNICKALAWLNTESTAAGLWGRDDYPAMLKAIEPLKEYIKIKFTQTPGQTRQNITIVDTAGKREMHLRAESKLASAESMEQLSSDLKKIVNPDSICVFAGAMPSESFMAKTLSMIETAKEAGCKIVIDTSGPPLKSIVAPGGIYMIKPNVEELSELLDKKIPDEPDAIIAAASTLLDKVEVILVSRGSQGAIAITKEQTIQARYLGEKIEVNNTVACGDFLLAGVLSILSKKDLTTALKVGIKVATARAAGWTENKTWPELENKIKVEISKANPYSFPQI